MTQPRDSEALLDMADYAQRARSFAAGFSKAEFEADDKTVAAVMYAIAIVGEASKRLSKEFRDSHGEIPWRDIAGMRDRLVHDYKKIDSDMLWHIMNEDLPDLLAQIQPLLPQPEE